MAARESQKLRKELTDHPFLESLDKVRGSGWRAFLREGVMRLHSYVTPAGFSVLRRPDAVPSSGKKDYMFAVYPNTLEELKEFLEKGCTDNLDTYMQSLSASKDKEAAREEERGKAHRGSLPADIPDDMANQYPLLRSNMLVASYPLVPANPMPVIASHPTFKKLAETAPDAAAWQLQALAAVSKQLDKLARLRADIIAMDVTGYQKALEALKEGAAKFIEEGQRPLLTDPSMYEA